MNDIAKGLDQISHRYDQNLSDAEQRILDRAIDQLRWRRVEDELPTEEGVYLVMYQHSKYPDVDFYLPSDETGELAWYFSNAVSHWRPITLPEDEG